MNLNVEPLGLHQRGELLAKEGDQRLMEIRSYSPSGSKRAKVVELRKDKKDSTWRGQLTSAGLLGIGKVEVTVAPSEDGMMLLGGGEKQYFKSIDLEDGHSSLSFQQVQAWFEKEILKAIEEDLGSKSHSCGSWGLSARKRAHLKALLKKSTFKGDIEEGEQGQLFQPYTFKGSLSFPEMELLQEKVSTCIRYGKGWESSRCKRYAERDWDTKTKAFSLELEVAWTASRFSEVVKKSPSISIQKINSEKTYFPISRVLCRQTLTKKEKLAYAEKQREIAKPESN